MDQLQKVENTVTLEVEASYADLARGELRRQRQRNFYFSNSHVFGDAAWELVLEAYIAASENRCVALADLGQDLRRPVPIIVRLAKILEDEGYVEPCRSGGSDDPGCIQLTDDAVIWCEKCLDLNLGGGDIDNN